MTNDEDSNPTSGPELNLSHFYMWRAVVALIHVDGKVTQGERDLVLKLMVGLNTSVEQRDILDQDLENGLQLEDVLDEIIDHRDFAHLIQLSKSVFMSDQDFNEIEQETISFLKREYKRRFPAFPNREGGGVADYARGVQAGSGLSSIVGFLRNPLIRYVLMGALTMGLLYGVLMKRLTGLEGSSPMGELCPQNMSPTTCQTMTATVYGECQISTDPKQPEVDVKAMKACLAKARKKFLQRHK